MTKKLLLLLALVVMAVGTACAKHTVRILAVGNSFSEDAIEQNLHEIAQAAGITAVVGNLYIPGCSLERHIECSKSQAPAYRYRKTNAKGIMTEAAKCRLDSALADERWDYISVQQASHFSGDYSTYQPYLEQLVAYIKAHAVQYRTPGSGPVVAFSTCTEAATNGRVLLFGQLRAQM